jgi:hypothetical protein
LLKQKDARDAKLGLGAKRRPIFRAPAAQLFGSEQEYRYFQRFCSETAIQLSGSFDTDLWQRVVLQTSETEPAIRHAVTAIGALNFKARAIGGDEADRLRCEFAYRQYGLAIAGIRQRTAERQADIRTKLLACILFTCFESYHGDSEAAATQTFAGIDMMDEYLESRERARGESNWPLTMTLPPIDQDITQALLSLEMQCCAHRQRSTEFHLRRMSAWQSTVDNMPNEFKTIKQARISLSHIILRGTHFIIATRCANLPAVLDVDSCIIDPLYAQLCSHFSEFHRWHTAFVPLLRKARMPHGKHMFKTATLLEIHYLACYLWLAASSPVQLYYTRYTRELSEIVRLSKVLLDSSPLEPNFGLDSRLVMPLNTIGLRYRHRALRREVIDILSRKECPKHDGVWDGTIVRNIMEFMAELEEEGLEDEEYVPQELAAKIFSMQINMLERTTSVTVLLPSKLLIGEMEFKERTWSW